MTVRLSTTLRFNGIRRLRGVLLGLVCAGALFGGTAVARAQTDEPFRLGASATGILVWVANDLGLFEQNDVDVALRSLPSGVEALTLVQDGTLDLGASSEFAFISRAIHDPGLCIYATISASRTIRLLSRADRVGEGAEALRGKRIGVTFGAATRFFLWQYLALAGISEDEVTLVNLKPDAVTEAMVAGTVDAGIVWEPHVTNIRKSIDTGLIEYAEQSDQHYYFTLQGRCDLAERKPDQLRGVLHALVEAERVSLEDATRAQAAFANRFGLDAAEALAIWQLHTLNVSLPQDLLYLMELQTKWRASTGRDEGATLNALERIRTEPLAEVAPNAVRIIR